MAALGAAMLLAAALGACGKKSPPGPPDGLEAEYTWPRAYPAPIGVAPAAAEEEETTPSASPAPAASPLSPFPEPFNRTRSTTYGPKSSGTTGTQ